MDDRSPLKTIIMQVPTLHPLFASKFLKHHNFVDSTWTPDSKVTQLKKICTTMEKHVNFSIYESQNKRKAQTQQIIQLRKECAEARARIQKALYGDRQELWVYLQDHKDIRLLYAKMSMDEIIDDIFNKTFAKRKDADRLRCKRDEMTKIYEKKIINLSKMQDMVSFQEFTKTENTAHAIRKAVKSLETRKIAFRTTSKALQKIISALSKDEIYYSSVLDGLQRDLKEQGEFIQQVIQIGRPALLKQEMLNKQYINVEEKTKKTIREKIGDANKIQKYNSFQAGTANLIRRPSDFMFDGDRFNRETSSMHQLKNKFEEVDKKLKKLKAATLSAHVDDIFPTIKKTFGTNAKFEKSLKFMGIQKEMIRHKQERGLVLSELLNHNLTPEELERGTIAAELINKIATERKEQQEIEKEIVKHGEVLSVLRLSLQQLDDVMRHVGRALVPPKRHYPNLDLALPVLKFDAFPKLSSPPTPLEEESEKLLDTIMSRSKILMTAFQEKTSSELNLAVREYHNQYMAALASSYVPVESFPIIAEEDAIDSTIMTRDQIKAIAAKIVEEHANEDD